MTELLTITADIGNPPRKPLIILPNPWAISSRSAGATLRNGSSLSAASRLRRDSMLAIKAKVIPVKIISDFKKKEYSGNVIWENILLKFSNTGRLTKCSGKIAREVK